MSVSYHAAKGRCFAHNQFTGYTLHGALRTFTLHTHAAIQCSALGKIPNGFITYTPDITPNYDLGTVATYACDPGFALDLSLGGSEMRTCVNDNKLGAIAVFDRQAPICVRKFPVTLKLICSMIRRT